MKSILLVEDDPFLIDIYTTKLKESGFEVEVASDGGEGLKKIKEKTPDLVLLDIILPKIDGWELLRKIKMEKEFKDLKIIIISNLYQKLEVEKGLKFGVIKYLIKAHYTPSQIAEEVKKTLK